jgi:glycosyltransferase involved in cell wall biosynthesis
LTRIARIRKTQVANAAKKSGTTDDRSFAAWLLSMLLRGFLLVYLAMVKTLGFLRKPAQLDLPADVLLTGTFYSDNWVLSHIRPLAKSDACRNVYLVSTHDLASFDNVVVLTPPRSLRRVLGDVGARLVYFFWIAVRRKPQLVGGFHLLFNGLVAGFVGRLLGRRSVYFCVGGPAEVLDGGLMSENRVFERIQAPDPVIERRLLRAIDTVDLVVTMGTGAKDFLQECGVGSEIRVVSGCINVGASTACEKEYDLVFVGRLAEIKRVDLFLETVSCLVKIKPDLTAAIVGDGALRQQLQTLAAELQIADRVTFAGFRDDVGEWLSRSKVFVLTSDSEGLSLALMEAMAAGLPAVVSNVGDLSDLVVDGDNGYLVDEQDPQLFSDAIGTLLLDEDHLARASTAARQAAEMHSVERCALRWDETLMDLSKRGVA